MSKITNDGLTRSNTGCWFHSYTHMATVGVKGLRWRLGSRIALRIRLEILGSVVSSPAGSGAETCPEINLVYFIHHRTFWWKENLICLLITILVVQINK